MFAFGFFKIALKVFEVAAGGKIALDLVLQRFDQARHADEHRHAFVVNRACHFGRIERVKKHRRASQNLRQKNS